MRLTDEDREALYDALCTNPMHGRGRSHDDDGACIVERDVTALVERIVRRHRAEALREAGGEVSDGYHTFNELYEYRMLYNAHAARGWLAAGIPVVKSWRHSDGGECFGGGWFIVTADLSIGQVSNHYEAEHWGLFDVPEVPTAPEWDGHTPAEAAQRLRDAVRIAREIGGRDES